MHDSSNTPLPLLHNAAVLEFTAVSSTRNRFSLCLSQNHLCPVHSRRPLPYPACIHCNRLRLPNGPSSTWISICAVSFGHLCSDRSFGTDLSAATYCWLVYVKCISCVTCTQFTSHPKHFQSTRTSLVSFFSFALEP